VAALTGVVGAGLGAIAGARFASRRERSAPETRRRVLQDNAAGLYGISFA